MSIFRKKATESEERVVTTELYDAIFYMKNGQKRIATGLRTFPTEYTDYPGFYWLKWPEDTATKTTRYESIPIDDIDRAEITRTKTELILKKVS